jgi:hypothetical protein
VTRCHRGLFKPSFWPHFIVILSSSVKSHISQSGVVFCTLILLPATGSIPILMPRNYGKAKQARLSFAPLSSSPPGADRSTRSQKDRLATLRYDHPSLPSLRRDPLQRGKPLTRREESSTPPKKVLSEGTPSSEPEQNPQRPGEGRFGPPHSSMYLSLIGFTKTSCQQDHLSRTQFLLTRAAIVLWRFSAARANICEYDRESGRGLPPYQSCRRLLRMNV